MASSPDQPAGFRDDDAAHAARGGAVQVLAALGQAVLPLYQALVARLFGAAVYGMYQSSAALVEVLVRGGLLGSDKGMLRYVAAHRVAGRPDGEAAALGTGLRLAALGTGLLGLALAVAAPAIARLYGTPAIGFALAAMSPAVPITALTLVLVAATLGARTSRVHLAVRGIAEPLALLAAATAAWALGASLRGLVVAHVAAELLVLALAAVGARGVFGPGRIAHALRAPAQPGFTRFAAPLGASEVLNAILQRADIVILNVFLEPATVAVYLAAEQLARAVAGVRYAFDGVAAPVLAEALEQRSRERLQYNLALVTRWVALASAPIAAISIVLRPELLRLFGPAYVAGSTVMLLVVLGHLVNGVLGMTPYVLVMAGRSRLFLVHNLGAAAVNVALNLWLVPRLGIVGAGIAALGSVAALQVALGVSAWVIERVHCASLELGKPFVAAGLVLGLGLSVRDALPLAARLPVVLVGGAVVYVAVLWALRPAREERALVRSLLDRLRALRS